METDTPKKWKYSQWQREIRESLYYNIPNPGLDSRRSSILHQRDWLHHTMNWHHRRPVLGKIARGHCYSSLWWQAIYRYSHPPDRYSSRVNRTYTKPMLHRYSPNSPQNKRCMLQMTVTTGQFESKWLCRRQHRRSTNNSEYSNKHPTYTVVVVFLASWQWSECMDRGNQTPVTGWIDDVSSTQTICPNAAPMRHAAIDKYFMTTLWSVSKFDKTFLIHFLWQTTSLVHFLLWGQSARW